MKPLDKIKKYYAPRCGVAGVHAMEDCGSPHHVHLLVGYAIRTLDAWEGSLDWVVCKLRLPYFLVIPIAFLLPVGWMVVMGFFVFIVMPIYMIYRVGYYTILYSPPLFRELTRYLKSLRKR